MALFAVALLIPACAPANDSAEPPADTTGQPAGTATRPAADDAPVCLREGPAVSDGPIALDDAAPGDARRVGALRWHAYDGCERLVIDLLGQDGSPAERTGALSALVLRALGVVRVELRDVTEVDPDATDATFAGPLARAAYSVISGDGRRVYVDVHLGAAAEAIVTTLSGPARVVVDVRPGGGPLPEPAPAGPRVVVLEPRPGPATYPLIVTGYARTFEANVVVRIERDGEDVHEDFTTATAWTEAWGHYSVTVPDGPAGRVVLHVGEYSARDGSWEGVVVPLELR